MLYMLLLYHSWPQLIPGSRTLWPGSEWWQEEIERGRELCGRAIHPSNRKTELLCRGSAFFLNSSHLICTLSSSCSIHTWSPCTVLLLFLSLSLPPHTHTHKACQHLASCQCARHSVPQRFPSPLPYETTVCILDECLFSFVCDFVACMCGELKLGSYGKAWRIIIIVHCIYVFSIISFPHRFFFVQFCYCMVICFCCLF